jgi:NDP-sugar pyrophosphorylase family protein
MINAMIFAAGLGTRLKPLTDTMPKAMVPFHGKPLLWHSIRSVEKAGAERVVVNVHHFAGQIIEYIKQEKWDSEVVISDERNELLDTGGGLIKAMPLFIKDKPILIRNADIITSYNLKKLVTTHTKQGCDASLLVMKRKSSRYLIFDDNMILCGWKNVSTGETISIRDCDNESDFGFCGIQILNYNFIKNLGEQRKFSIIKGYLNTGADTDISGIVLPKQHSWFDVGSAEKLKEAEHFYFSK